MKSIIKKFFNNKLLAKLLIRSILKMHSISYKLAGRFAVILNNGIHPKHHIIKYKEWFLENIEPGWVVLDIGSNTGMLPVLLAEKAEKVYGIEINEKHVQKAKAKNKKDNIEYICADATTYDYDSCQPIDCVTMSNVLEHIKDRVAFLTKISNQIKWNDEENKRFLIRVPAIDREWIVLYKKEMGLDHRLDPAHHVEYTLDQLKEELSRANISVSRVDRRFGEIFALCEFS